MKAKKKVIRPSPESYRQCGGKARKFLRGLNKRKYECMPGKDRWTDIKRGKTDKFRQSCSHILSCICSFFAHKQCPCCSLFFPHKKISFKRWRNSPRLQCAHLLWCLFIIFLAALLDWHSSLEHLTTALYSWTSHYPLNIHMLNPPMGKPSLFLHSRRVKNLWQSILRHKQFKLVRLTCRRQGDCCDLLLSLFWVAVPAPQACLSPTSSCSSALVVQFLSAITRTLWYIIWIPTLFHLFM